MTTKVNFWKTLLVSPLALGAALAAFPQASFAQATGPVTAISELTDVRPTDWAFQALQSLVERYGCIAGYPDRTFRGNRAMTRFEFAAGMNACLDRMNELIAAGLADKVSRDDLATLQRLQEEFASELSALKGRVDALQADVTTLREQVFNPVTKLNAQVVAALVFQGLSDDILGPTGPLDADGFPTAAPGAFIGNGGALVRRDAASTTLNYRVRLNFDASFTGRDRLRIRLQAREFNPAFFVGDPGFGVAGGDRNLLGTPIFSIDDLVYRFPMFNRAVTAHIGLNSFAASDVFRYDVPFDALSDAADAPDLTHDVTGDTGFAFNWRASEQITLSYGYSSAGNLQGVRPGGAVLGGAFGSSTGLFGSSSAHAVELNFTPAENLSLYLGFASQYLAGPRTQTDGYSIAVNWDITPRVQFSGWYSFGTESPKRGGPSTDLNGFLVGFNFPDLFMEGAQGGIVFSQLEGETIGTRPSVLDVYYSFPVSDFITLTPGFYIVSNPLGGNLTTTFPNPGAGPARIPNANDPSIIVGALRATFSF